MKKLEYDQIKSVIGDENRIFVAWDDFKDSDGYVDLSFFHEYVKFAANDCKIRLCKILNLNADNVTIYWTNWINSIAFDADLRDQDWEKAMAYIRNVEAVRLDDMLVMTITFLKLMERFIETKGKGCSEQEIYKLKERTHSLHFGLSGGLRYPGDLVSLLETGMGEGHRVWYDEEMDEFVLVQNRSVESMTYADIVAMTKSSIPFAKKTVKAIIERIKAL